MSHGFTRVLHCSAPRKGKSRMGILALCLFLQVFVSLTLFPNTKGLDVEPHPFMSRGGGNHAEKQRNRTRPREGGKRGGQAALGSAHLARRRCPWTGGSHPTPAPTGAPVVARGPEQLCSRPAGQPPPPPAQTRGHGRVTFMLPEVAASLARPGPALPFTSLPSSGPSRQALCCP